MSKPRFPATVESDLDDLERRLEALERSGGTGSGVTGGDLPIGAITAFWGTAAPAGWLLCDGSSFSGTTYPDLAAHLGGTTLPNLKGKVIVGRDAAQTEFDVLGETGGSKDAIAVTHDHDTVDHYHGTEGHSGSTEPPNHIHLVDSVFGITTGTHAHYIGGGPGEIAAAPQGSGRADSHGQTLGVNSSIAHDHLIDMASVIVDNAGSSGTGKNLQPYIALSWIIKAT